MELEDTMNQENEMKDLDISALLKLSIKIYEENKMDALEDIRTGCGLLPNGKRTEI